MKRARREVEVVEFVDPFLKRANRSTTVTNRKRLKQNSVGNGKKDGKLEKDQRKEEDTFKKRDIFEEVMALGASKYVVTLRDTPSLISEF